MAPAAPYAVTVPQVQVAPASPPATPEQPTRRRRRRALSVIVAAAIAVTAAGCTHVKVTTHTTTAAPKQSAVEQVVTTCVQNLYYNGLLPQAAAKTNCAACVADELEKLGVEPTPGQSQTAMIDNAILSHSNLTTLQDLCNQADSF